MGIANPFTVLKESLRIRIFTLSTLLILLISTTFIIFHFNSESASLTERSVIEGNLLARLLAYNSRIAVFAEHADMLREAADGVLQNDDVISATVFSADGKVLINRAGCSEEGRSRQSEGSLAFTPPSPPFWTGKRNPFTAKKPITSNSLPR